MTTPTDTFIPLRIVLVENQEITMAGLNHGLIQSGKVEILAKARNGAEALAAVERYEPDMVLMDIEMPVMDGIDCTRAIKANFPQVKIIVLTSHDEPDSGIAAFTSGADGYCVKSISIAHLLQVIEMVNDGGAWFDPGVSEEIVRIINQTTATAEEEPPLLMGTSKLDRDEREILVLMSKGMSRQQIADNMQYSVAALKTRVNMIRDKIAQCDRVRIILSTFKPYEPPEKPICSSQSK